MIPILLLHGALGSETQLDPLAKLIRESRREVWTMNFSGHGGKPVANQGISMAAFVNDVISFMDQHQMQRIDIFGYSMGGYAGLLLAKHYPDRIRSIITLGTKFDWNPESAEYEVRKMNPEKIIEKIPAFARLLEHRHLPNDWKELMKETAMMIVGLGSKPLLNEENLNGLSQRVLIALGDHDDVTDRGYSQEVAKWLKGQFRLLPNTAHPIEKADLGLLANLIHEWNLQIDS